MEEYTRKIVAVLQGTYEKLQRFKARHFILHFLTTVQKLNGVIMECVVECHAVAAEFTELTYEQKREVIVDWVNEVINIPGPSEEEEKRYLLIPLFDALVALFEKITNQIWGEQGKEASALAMSRADAQNTKALVAAEFLPYLEWTESDNA